MVYKLCPRFPEFSPIDGDEKPLNFGRALVNACQIEFEAIPWTFVPTEEESAKYSPREDLELYVKQKKDKLLANMKFIGNLYLRDLLSLTVIHAMVQELIGIREELPEEHLVECVVELLRSTGYAL